jgi:hypothetical protein
MVFIGYFQIFSLFFLVLWGNIFLGGMGSKYVVCVLTSQRG